VISKPGALPLPKTQGVSFDESARIKSLTLCRRAGRRVPQQSYVAFIEGDVMATDMGQAGRARGGEGTLTLILSITLLFLITLFVWRAHPFTTDFPWLWRTGTAILHQGGLPAADPFSWTHHGEPWLLYQWLFEVTIAVIVGVVGFKGLFALYQSVAVGLYLVAP